MTSQQTWTGRRGGYKRRRGGLQKEGEREGGRERRRVYKGEGGRRGNKGEGKRDHTSSDSLSHSFPSCQVPNELVSLSSVPILSTDLSL